jgi:hypothetical protein
VQSLLHDAFAPRTPAASGRIDLALRVVTLGARGSGQPREMFALRLIGPFRRLGPGRLPSFALQLYVRSGAAGPPALDAGITSAAGQLFVKLAGKEFRAPPATARALEQGYAEAGAGSNAANGTPASAAGLDAAGWVVHPRIVGSAHVAGTATTRILADMNLARFLSDVQKLSTAAGPLALGPGSQGSSLLATALAAARSGQLRGAHLNVYTGTHDHLLRRLGVTVAVGPSRRAGGSAAVRAATIALVVQLTELNRPQTISTPSNPRPASELPAALAQLGAPAAGHS